MSCRTGNIDMLSAKVFLPWERKDLLQHTFDNEVSALARLTFYENLLIGPVRNKCLLSAVTGVRIKRVEFRENVGAFPGTKKTARNNEVSVLLAGVRKAGAWLNFDYVITGILICLDCIASNLGRPIVAVCLACRTGVSFSHFSGERRQARSERGAREVRDGETRRRVSRSTPA